MLTDSNSNGIGDVSEDFDEDSLTNLQEYTYNTDPFLADTDFDGLSDYDEVFVYFTNPSLYDTDEDGLGDWLEITVGLNPFLADTYDDGVLDGDRTVTQPYLNSVTENFDLEETLVLPEVEITGVGDYTQKIAVEDIYYNELISDLDYVIGHPFDFKHDNNLEFDSSTLSFTLHEDVLSENNPEDLAIAWYNEETGRFEIVDTTYHTDTKKLSAEVEHYSVFAVISLLLFADAILQNPNAIKPQESYQVKAPRANWGINLQIPSKKFHVVIYEYDILTNAAKDGFCTYITSMIPSYITKQ